MDNRRGSGGKRAFFYNGSEYLQETDLSLPGIMPIVIQRTYNNQSTFDSPLGYGWDFSFNDRLRTYADNSVIIRTTAGSKLHFIFTGGNYICEEDQHITLIQNPDGTFLFYEDSTAPRYQYDIKGRLVRKEDLNGNSIRMLYSDDPKPLIGLSPNSITPETPLIVSNNYQLQRIEQWDNTGESTGRYVDFHYDTNSGRLASITDSTARTISYQQDTSGNLSRVDYPEEMFKTYEYTDSNDPHNMTNDFRGYDANAPVLQTTRQYDVDDRMIREEHAGGIMEISYTIPMQKTTVTKTIVDNQGISLHHFNTVYEFNIQGYLIQTTDDDKSLELVRDNRNNIIENNIYVNTGTFSSPHLEPYSSIAFTFDSNNNMIHSLVVLEDGEKIQTNNTYDNGLLTEQQLFSSKTPDQIHKTFIEYNHLDGLPTTVASSSILKNNTLSPSYNSTYYRYDGDNKPIEIRFDNGDTYTMEYQNGQLIKTDQNSLTYDNRGNVVMVENANNHKTFYEYDAIGRNTKITNPLGEETLFAYTGWNLTSIESGRNDGQPGHTTNFIYDNFGRLSQSSSELTGTPILQKTFTYDSDNNLLSVTDQQGRTNTTTYDPWGHILTNTDATGNSTTYHYSELGQLLSSTNALAQTKTFTYDKLNRLIKVTNPLNGSNQITYNENNRVTKFIDEESREFTFGYNLAGQKIWQKSPVSGPVSYKYDNRGRTSLLTLPDGTENTYKYDKYNRIEEVTLAKNTSESTILRYGYNRTGNLLWYSDSSIGLTPLLQMTYDSLGRLQTKTITPINKTLQLTYNHHGQREQLAVFDNTTELFHYSFTYDPADRLTALTEQQQATVRTTTFSSDNTNLLISKTYPNGVTADLGYNANRLLTDLHYKKSDSTTIAQFQYNYDPLGRMTELTDEQGTTIFQYDTLGHLISADYPATSVLADESFTFDQTDNRLTSIDITDWTYDQGGKLTSYNNHNIFYDANGSKQTETIAADSTTYKFDTANRLTKIQGPSLLSTYSYDYANRRIQKTVNGSSTWFLYDGANILAEFDQSGNLIENITYLPGTSDMLAVTKGIMSNTVLTSHIQSPLYVFDNNQSLLWQARYQAFGKAMIDNDVDNNGNIISIKQRFPGQYADSETGLYYNWNRFYNPETGRYISTDPMGISSGINLYGYAGASPVNYIDPTGLVCEETEKRTIRNDLMYTGATGMIGFGGLVATGFGMLVSGGVLVTLGGLVIVPVAFTGATLSFVRFVGGATSSTEEHAASVKNTLDDADLLVGPVSGIYILMGDKEGAKEGKFVWENKRELTAALIATKDFDLALDLLNLMHEVKQHTPNTDRNQEAIVAAIKQAMEDMPPPTTSVEGRTFDGSRERITNWLREMNKNKSPNAANSSSIKD